MSRMGASVKRPHQFLLSLEKFEGVLELQKAWKKFAATLRCNHPVYDSELKKTLKMENLRGKLARAYDGESGI